MTHTLPPHTHSILLHAAAGIYATRTVPIHEPDAVMAARIACTIIENWILGVAAPESFIIHTQMGAYHTESVKKNFEHGLNAAKFIAHSTNLKIPRETENSNQENSNNRGAE